MAKRGRRWVPLDVDFMTDQKILEAGEPAGWLYIGILCLIKRQQQRGCITLGQIETLPMRRIPNRLERLLKLGLLEHMHEDVYLVPAWEDWDSDAGEPSSDRAEYMRAWRADQRRRAGRIRSVNPPATDQ